jgi:hypothetical protein
MPGERQQIVYTQCDKTEEHCTCVHPDSPSGVSRFGVSLQQKRTTVAAANG